jgi:uncharacterized protein YjbJ (UPF0337 family)
MNTGTENEVAGKIHELKGKIKEKIAQLTNNPNLEDEGTSEKIAGKVQKKIGQVEKLSRNRKPSRHRASEPRQILHLGQGMGQ